MVVVFVGVMIVVGIEIVVIGKVKFIGCLELNQYDLFLDKGVEFGCFYLGLIVVVLFEKDKMMWDVVFKVNLIVVMGEVMGYIV